MAAQQYTPRRPYVASNAAMPTVLYTRTSCGRCDATGTLAGEGEREHYCSHCDESWSPVRFDLLMEAIDRRRFFWRKRYLWDVLPCGCPVEYARYSPVVCPECHGDGYVFQRAVRDDLRRAGMLVSDELPTPRTGTPHTPYRAHVPYVPPIRTTQPLHKSTD